MSNWLVAGLVGVAIVISIGDSTATAADGTRSPVGAYTVTAGRLVAIVAGLVGLIGVVSGGLALRSAGRTGTGSGRNGAIAAVVAGLIGTVLGGLVVTTAGGGVGTGNGFGGGIVALVVGLIGTTLGGLALARSRRKGGQFSPIPSLQNRENER